MADMTDEVRGLLGGEVYDQPVRDRMKRQAARLKVIASSLGYEGIKITGPRGTEWDVVKHEIAEAERHVKSAIERLERMAARGELPESQPTGLK